MKTIAGVFVAFVVAYFGAHFALSLVATNATLAAAVAAGTVVLSAAVGLLVANAPD
jgi:hypothetical protein